MKIKMKHLIIAAIVKKVIFAVIALFFFTSCSIDRDDFSIESIDSVSLKETTMEYIIVNVDFMLKNESSVSVVVKDSELKLYDPNGKEICDAILIDPVKVKKGTNSTVVPVKVVFKGGLLGVARLVGLLNKDIDNMFVSGYVKVSKGAITVKKGIDRMRISGLK